MHWGRKRLRVGQHELPHVLTRHSDQVCYVSEPHQIGAHFNQFGTGHGPLHLIRSVQLNRARALLENSRYSVEAVAEQVGYGDPTALRRLLRQRLNATPRQLR